MLDTDPRQFSEPENFKYNHGSFSSVHINLNKSLKKLGYYSDYQLAKWVGITDGLNLGSFNAPNKKFIISPWEIFNTLTNFHIYSRESLNPDVVFGCSEAVSNLWRKAGYDCQTAYYGCDVEFWKPSKNKNEIFTFCITNSSNLRCAYDLIIPAFLLAFGTRKDVQLIIKDTNNIEKLILKIKEFQNLGMNLKYFSGRWPMQKIRDLYSESHVTINLQRGAGFGLTTLESMACNSVCLTADVAPANEIVDPTVAMMIEPLKPIGLNDYIFDSIEWGFLNCFGNFDYPEEPKIWDFDINTIASSMENLKENYSYYENINSRDHVVKYWNWDLHARKLVNLLNNS
ncbi:MAG: glycosyltransferase family 4 protein [Richelia sp. RM2_1_2]|nr:glycosyltransferase family 4 protein [Richelia sp. RM2_1_2]